ncbi:MAG: hypothetical protein JEY99_01650 [Spirochaetales bacterium]|nr:hypothetical protein [Spirochaetales bacterium]
MFERMNLHAPDTRTIIMDGQEVLMNSPMRASSAPKAPGKSLASQLTRAFGMAYQLGLGSEQK